MGWIVPSQALVKEYEFIAECDPALDCDAKDFREAYRRYREQGDRSGLPLRPGQTPAVWVLRHLIGRPLTRVMALMSEGNHLEGLYMAAQYTIKSVSGVSIDTGGDFELAPGICRDTRAPMLMDQQMAVLHNMSPALIYQLGRRAVEAASPGPLS